MSTSSSRRPQPRKPKLRGPLKPTTDLEVVAGEPPVTLAIPRPPRWLLPLLLAVVTLAVLAFPVREAVAEDAYRDLDEAWDAVQFSRPLRREHIMVLESGGDARDLEIADLLERTARNFEVLRSRTHGWRIHVDSDVERAAKAVDLALAYEAERLRVSAASYREHWSAGVNPCCGRTENAARRADVLLDRLEARFD